MPKLPVLVVLQNAYDKGVLSQKPCTVSWWKEFKSSRTGQRLWSMFNECGHQLEDFHFCNTTPKLGNGATSKLPPDLAHLRRVIKLVKPKLILACGKQAEEICKAEWKNDLVCIPHPCYRPLTDFLLYEAGNTLAWRICYYTDPGLCRACRANLAVPLLRIKFRQERGSYSVADLETENA